MHPIFVQLQCAPGRLRLPLTPPDGTGIGLFHQRRLRSDAEDLPQDGQDIGKFINDNIANIPGIVRS